MHITPKSHPCRYCECTASKTVRRVDSIRVECPPRVVSGTRDDIARECDSCHARGPSIGEVPPVDVEIDAAMQWMVGTTTSIRLWNGERASSPFEKRVKEVAARATVKIAEIAAGYDLEAPAGCDHCDDCGGTETYANQVCMAINGRVRAIDWCIHKIVAALNAGGVETIACCCGHGTQPGRIDLVDGRVLMIQEGVTND